MRILVLFLFLAFQPLVFGQKPCQYTTNVTDSLGTLKETKSCLVYEKVFGNTAQLIFLSLISNDGMPVLHLQVIQKSNDFISPKCIDKNSRIYFQLSNGKIFTLANSSENECGSLVYNDTEKLNNRLLNAYFLFLKDDYQDFKKFPVTMMRIKYDSESIDYILPKELHAEKVEGVFEPEDFFINNYPCIEN
ncbi:hypothetical protein [Flavobacterium humi]|uniref:Uncharacterized protein n=1 Tax=Flavobacterium humi TaxID=2562683 RepID=A0A4Z0LCW6_9FLAO|nr:hypothetical protein [Flavobacterium humi]TGD59739.1 hypothetical protein E4635_02045 [Flavobacterium humi]